MHAFPELQYGETDTARAVISHDEWISLHHRQDWAIKEWREQLQKAKYRLLDSRPTMALEDIVAELPNGQPRAWCRAPADVRARRAQRSGSRAQRWFRVDFVLRDPWRRNQRPWYSRDRPSLEPSDSRRDGGRAREMRAASRRANDDGRRPAPRLRQIPRGASEPGRACKS